MALTQELPDLRECNLALHISGSNALESYMTFNAAPNNTNMFTIRTLKFL